MGAASEKGKKGVLTSDPLSDTMNSSDEIAKALEDQANNMRVA
jgi:hypothetical protein